MPELAEVRLMRDFIESHLKQECVRVSFPERERQAHFQLKGQLFVESRGKELRLTNGSTSVLMGMGMTGNWYRTPSDTSWHKHDRLALVMADGYDIRLGDARRFAKWKTVEGVWWSSSRGPCPLTEHEDFVKHVFEKWKGGRGRKPVHQAMMDQGTFNGIGNYLRAEILGHAGIDPMKSLPEMDPSELQRLLTLCHTVPRHFYARGGGRIQTFFDPATNETWQRSVFDFYQNRERCVPVKDGQKRTFWMDKRWYDFHFL